MQRREFLQSTLALGAAGMLPDIGLASGLETDQTTFSFDADVVLVNEQGIAVALKYDETTMLAPVVQAKDGCLLTKRLLEVAAAKAIPFVRTEGRWVNIGLIKTEPNPSDIWGVWLVKWGFVVDSMGGVDPFPEKYLPLAQDIFDNLDINDVVPEKHYEIIADIMNYADRSKGWKAKKPCKPLDSPYNFRLDGEVVLVSKRGVTVVLRYDKETMIAPVVLAKAEATQRLLEKFAKGKCNPRVFTNIKRPGNSPFGEMFHRLRNVRCFLCNEWDEIVVQDLYDNLNVGDTIPEKHYQYVAYILERDRIIMDTWAKEDGRLTREEVDNLFREAEERLHNETGQSNV